MSDVSTSSIDIYLRHLGSHGGSGEDAGKNLSGVGDVGDLNNVTDGISDGGDIQLAARVAMGIGLYMLAMVTCVGNGMVIHAIRTEKRLRKVKMKLFLVFIQISP
jgi:hypothetical protein